MAEKDTGDIEEDSARARGRGRGRTKHYDAAAVARRMQEEGRDLLEIVAKRGTQALKHDEKWLYRRMKADMKLVDARKALELADADAAAAFAAETAQAPTVAKASGSSGTETQKTIRHKRRVMPKARWTTLEVASGASGINQGGALYVLMQHHAHLMQLAIVISLSYDGDIHEAKSSGATLEQLRAMRSKVIPWDEYSKQRECAVSSYTAQQRGEAREMVQESIERLWGAR